MNHLDDLDIANLLFILSFFAILLAYSQWAG